MTRKKREVTHVRLTDESEQVLNQYRQHHVTKNKTECICAILASLGSEGSWKKMTREFHPSLLETIEKVKLEVQRTEINRVLEKDTSVWDHQPNLRICEFRDLTLMWCRDLKPCLKTGGIGDLTPDVCLRCQRIRSGIVEPYKDYQLVQQARRLGGQKVSLVVGVKSERDAWKTKAEDWEQRFQDETRVMQNKHHFALKRRERTIHDLRETIKQRDTAIGDLNLKLIEEQTRNKKLKAIISDPQKFEKLESENQTLKTQLEKALSERDSKRDKNVELIRKKDQLSTELEIAQNKLLERKDQFSKELELAIQKQTHACMQKTITDATSKPESLRTKNDKSKKPEIARNQEPIAITTTTTTTVKLPQPIEREEKKPVMVKCELDGKQKGMDIDCQSCDHWKECKSYARAMGLY